jgi:ABC-type transport system involved in Fe-S cluster assembly fused permease/ATPase subunit
VVLSVVVGLALGAAYQLLSMRLQRWASQRKFMMVPLVTILGFVVRLVVLVGILAALGLWSHLNILAVCVSFIVLFTVLNGIWLYTLAIKRHGAPPSAGANGAN